MKTLHVCAISLLMAASAFARIINVPADYSTIQAGIDASVNGDTVLVAPGEYRENINPNGRNILITGGSGPDTTIIQGYIRFDHNEDSTCIFQGFKVIGQGQDPNIDVLPIIFIENSSPKIQANVLRSNTSGGYGGGIGIRNSASIIKHNIIENNWSWAWGGGIMIRQNCGNVEISRNVIRHNRSGFLGNDIGDGGGILCRGGSFYYNLIYGNEVRSACPEFIMCGMGGGFLIDTGEDGCAPVKIINNTIANNIALNRPYGDGGGIYVYRGFGRRDTVTIINNIITNNNRGGLYCLSESYIEYNLFYGDSSYDIIAPDTSETNLFSDPLLGDTLNGNYGLLPDSPCIDAGDPSLPLDPDSTRADIGALFFDHSVAIDEDVASSEPSLFQLHQNYPNPFNSSTSISYFLQTPSYVNLRIFDISGRLIRILVNNERQQGGEKRLIWDGKDDNSKEVSTAIYFVELSINNEKQVRSMILIR